MIDGADNPQVRPCNFNLDKRCCMVLVGIG
jgi:hypothetical protein